MFVDVGYHEIPLIIPGMRIMGMLQTIKLSSGCPWYANGRMAAGPLLNNHH